MSSTNSRPRKQEFCTRLLRIDNSDIPYTTMMMSCASASPGTCQRECALNHRS